jgi:hypothetical protein
MADIVTVTFQPSGDKVLKVIASIENWAYDWHYSKYLNSKIYT